MSQVCRWCEEDKELTEFIKHGRTSPYTGTADGYMAVCKACMSEANYFLHMMGWEAVWPVELIRALAAGDD